jgi:hypothetical protein
MQLSRLGSSATGGHTGRRIKREQLGSMQRLFCFSGWSFRDLQDCLIVHTAQSR